MKKVLGTIAVGALAFSLTACGAKTQTETYRQESNVSGIDMVEEMTFEAEGDKVVKITNTLEMDLSSFDADTIALLEETYDSALEQANAMDGVQCEASLSGTTYNFTMTVDVADADLNGLSDLGLLTLTGDADNGISLKETGEKLTGNGYEKVD